MVSISAALAAIVIATPHGQGNENAFSHAFSSAYTPSISRRGWKQRHAQLSRSQTCSTSSSLGVTTSFPETTPLEELQIEIRPQKTKRRIEGHIEIREPSNSKKMMELSPSITDDMIKTEPRVIKVKRRNNSSPKPALSIPNFADRKRKAETNEFGAFQMLTRDEEMKLTCSIRALREAMRLRDELVLDRKQNEPKYEPSELDWAQACGVSVFELRRIMLEGQRARSQLVSKNAGLVVQIAKRYRYRNKMGNSLTLQDMIQEGNLGLMEAAERFDPSRGFKFATYAAWWVRQRILRSIADHSRVIRLPVHVHTMVAKIDKKRKEMADRIGRTPSLPELAHELEIPIEKLRMYTDSSRSVISLERPINQSSFKDDHRTLSDKIASDIPTPEDDAEIDFLRQDIRAVIDELSTKERDVLVMRFGLDDGTTKTIDEVGSRLGISRERVRLLEARAINKLRHPGRNYKLKEYLDDSTFDELSEQEEPCKRTPEQIWSF